MICVLGSLSLGSLLARLAREHLLVVLKFELVDLFFSAHFHCRDVELKLVKSIQRKTKNKEKLSALENARKKNSKKTYRD